jgi:hypothetical protein
MATIIVNAPSLEECEKAISRASNCIGSGVDRQVFRLKDSPWVYKKERNGCKGVNASEYATYLELSTLLPEGVAFPLMALLDNGVIAAEFIDNEVDAIADPNSECDFDGHVCDNETVCWVTPWIALAESADVINDLHGGNVRINNGTLYIIDLGEYF